MSTSPNDAQDDGADKQSVDELAEANHADDPEAGSSTAPPVKRGRGRPKGSKNKKSLASGADSPTTPTIPRKRGRPPKEKKAPEESEGPTPKRPRGRPPKVPKPPAPAEDAPAASGSGEAAESSTKKKRGRPPKPKPAA